MLMSGAIRKHAMALMPTSMMLSAERRDALSRQRYANQRREYAD